MASNVDLNVNNEYEMQHRKKFNDNCKIIKSKKQIKKKYYDLFNNLEKVRDNLSYKVMVPLPAPKENGLPLAFIEGTAVHTNEIIMPLGCNYYHKGTAKDAMDLCMRKSKDVEKEIRDYEKEQTMLLERIAFMQLSADEREQIEIVEEFNEEEDKEWQKKHAESIRRMKQREAKDRLKADTDKASDNAYFARLDELEMEERLEELRVKEEK